MEFEILNSFASWIGTGVAILAYFCPRKAIDIKKSELSAMLRFKKKSSGAIIL